MSTIDNRNYLMQLRHRFEYATIALLDSFEDMSLRHAFPRALLGKKFYDYAEKQLPATIFDNALGVLNNPSAYPGIEYIAAVGENAAAGARLLCFESLMAHLDKELVRRQYFHCVQRYATNVNYHVSAPGPVPSLEVFKQIALTIYINAWTPQYKEPVYNDWISFLEEDVRWCLACPKKFRHLIPNNTATQFFWEAFDLYITLLTIEEAVGMVWALDPANVCNFSDALELPEMDI